MTIYQLNTVIDDIEGIKFTGMINNNMVAFAQLYLTSNHKDQCILESVYIHSSYQRNGYGEQLIEYVIQEAIKTDKKYIVLQVHKDNIPAQQLYKKLGFIKYNTDNDNNHFYAFYIEL